MKRLIYLFSMLLVASMTSVALTSCGDDDEDESDTSITTDDEKNPMVGKTINYSDEQKNSYWSLSKKHTITFNDADTFTYYFHEICKEKDWQGNWIVTMDNENSWTGSYIYSETDIKLYYDSGHLACTLTKDGSYWKYTVGITTYSFK